MGGGTDQFYDEHHRMESRSALPMLVLDEQLRIRHWNPPAVELFGRWHLKKGMMLERVLGCSHSPVDQPGGNGENEKQCCCCLIRNAVRTVLNGRKAVQHVECGRHPVDDHPVDEEPLRFSIRPDPDLNEDQVLIILEGMPVDGAGYDRLEQGVFLPGSRGESNPRKALPSQLEDIINSIPADVYVSDLETYEILYMNQRMIDNFGGDYTGAICWEAFRSLEGPCPHCTNPELLDDQGEPAGVVEWETKNPLLETWYQNFDRAIPWVDGRYVRLQIATDITKRKRAEQALQASEEQFSKAFQGGPLMMSITELEDGTFLEVNDNFIETSGYSRIELVGRSSLELEIISASDRERMLEELEHAGRIHDLEITLQKRDGRQIPCQYFGELISVGGEERLLSIGEDISRRKQMEQEREESLQEMQAINRFMTRSSRLDDLDEICQLAAEIVSSLNPEAVVAVSYYDEDQGGIRLNAVRGFEDKPLQKAGRLLGFDLEDGLSSLKAQELPESQDMGGLFVGGKLQHIPGGIYDLAFQRYPKRICSLVESVLGIEEIYSIGFSREDVPRGGLMFFLPSGVSLRFINALESIASHTAVLLDDLQYRRQLVQKRQEAEILREVGVIVSQSLNQEDATLLILDQLEKVIDYDSATVQLVVNEGIRVDAVRGPEQESLLNQVYQTSEKEIIQSILLDVEAVVVEDLKLLENWIEFPGSQGVRSWLGVPLVARGKKIGVLTLAHQEVGYYSEEDLELVTAFASQAAITLENKRLFEEAQRRLSRLSALRDIDQTIIGSLDVKLTLRVLLDQLVKELKVDAVDVYLYDSLWTTLDYAVSRGFREEAYLDSLSLEDGLIGGGLVNNKLIRFPDLQSADIDHVRKEHFAREGFVSYFGLPLVAKGELAGILEVFHRQPFKPDPEWLDFLKALAGQAAISIDRLNLYLELKQSNMELVQAYDETIASLARALELRDLETQGHCQRVESLTLQLARECGVDSEDLLYLRWGALLHDLGKIGIPDRILHKPGKLTEEEWEIMREHPEYAYEMLSSIDYLSPALDIPRYHHERWDGSGYPEGLAGERIPLPARIFAVVDVWDALRSDRPYRKAWSDQRAREYLEEMAGQEFDPMVVERFLNLLGETNSRINPGQNGCGGRDDQS